MTHPDLQRDVTYLDLVSELKGEPAGFGEYARQLVEATGAGSLADANRALAVLEHEDPQAYRWDRPLTRQDRLDRHARYEACIQEGEKTLAHTWWGDSWQDGAEMGRAIGMLGLFFGFFLFVFWMLTEQLTLGRIGFSIFGLGIATTTLGYLVGGYFGHRHRGRYTHLRAQIKAARELLEEETPVELDVRQGQRWLAFPEVALQARRWIRSSPGLMRRDVDLLDARLAELQAAADAYKKGSLLRRLVGVGD